MPWISCRNMLLLGINMELFVNHLILLSELTKRKRLHSGYIQLHTALINVSVGVG